MQDVYPEEKLVSEVPKFVSGSIASAHHDLVADIKDGKVIVSCPQAMADAVVAALQAANTSFAPFTEWEGGVGFKVFFDQESTLDATRDRVFAALSVVARLADSQYQFDVGGDTTLILNFGEINDGDDDAYLLTIGADIHFSRPVWQAFADALREPNNADVQALAKAGFEFHEVDNGGLITSIPLVNNLAVMLGLIAKLFSQPRG